MLAVLEGDAAPRLVARLAGGRNRPPAPQLLARPRVVGGDDAGVRPAVRHAAPARERSPAADDRPRGLRRRVDPVVEDLRLPHLLAGLRVESEDVVVRAGVDDVAAVDGHVPVGLEQVGEDVLLHVLRHLAPVLPDEVAGDGVDRLDDVARVRHVEHAPVGQRCPLLAARPERARPDHPQVADVVPVDLIERAVAPAVLRPAPHQPVAGRRVLQHGVGDGHEPVVRRLRAGASRPRETDCRCYDRQPHDAHPASRFVHVAPRSVRLPAPAAKSAPTDSTLPRPARRQSLLRRRLRPVTTSQGPGSAAATEPPLGPRPGT